MTQTRNQYPTELVLEILSLLNHKDRLEVVSKIPEFKTFTPKVYVVFRTPGSKIPRFAHYKKESSFVHYVVLNEEYKPSEIDTADEKALVRRIREVVSSIKSYHVVEDVTLEFCFDMESPTIYNQMNIYPLIYKEFKGIPHSIELFKRGVTEKQLTKSRCQQVGVFDYSLGNMFRFDKGTDILRYEVEEQVFAVGDTQFIRSAMLFLEYPEEVKNEILDVNNKDLLDVEVTLLPKLVSAPKAPTAPTIKTRTRMKMTKIASSKTPVYTRLGISKYEHLLLDKVKSPYYQELSEIVELRSVNRYKYLARLKKFVEREVQTVSLDYLNVDFRELAYKAWKVDDDFYRWIPAHKSTIREHLNPKFIHTLGTDKIYTPDGLKKKLDNYEVMVIPHLHSHKKYQYLFKTAMKILLRGLEHRDQKKVMSDCAKKIYTMRRDQYVIQRESNLILDLVKYYIHESEQLGYEPKAISIKILSDATSWTEDQVKRKIERSYSDVLDGLQIKEAAFE